MIEISVRYLGVFLFLALAPLAAAAAGVSSGRPQETKVILFRPLLPSGPSRSGECWTDSIAVARSGAWRCMAGNEIFDPCFSSAGLTEAVVCGANPAQSRAGFILKLAKPLPKPSSWRPAHPRPWLVKLADNTTCAIQTGTIGLVA